MRPTCRFTFPPGPKCDARLLLDFQHRSGTRFSMYAAKTWPRDPERRLALLQALGFQLAWNGQDLDLTSALTRIDRLVGAQEEMPVLDYLQKLCELEQPREPVDPNDPRFEEALG